MFHKVAKKFFKLLINFLQFLRVSLIFLAFATVLYWFMQLSGATFFDFVTLIFESIKNFIHSFYTRTVVIDQSTIDFSFLLATFIMLGISFGIKFAVEAIEFVESKYDAMHSEMKQKAEKLFNLNLEQHYIHLENKNNNALILVKISASNMTKDSYFNKDVSVGVEEKQKEVVDELAKIISAKINCQTKTSASELLISFKPFGEVDRAMSELQTAITDLQNKYKQEKWKIESTLSAETFAKEDEIAAKLLSLKKLIKLGLKGEITCLSTMNQRYSLIKNPKYMIEGKGIYTINDQEETVFCIKERSFT